MMKKRLPAKPLPPSGASGTGEQADRVGIAQKYSIIHPLPTGNNTWDCKIQSLDAGDARIPAPFHITTASYRLSAVSSASPCYAGHLSLGISSWGRIRIRSVPGSSREGCPVQSSPVQPPAAARRPDAGAGAAGAAGVGTGAAARASTICTVVPREALSKMKRADSSGRRMQPWEAG
ncbi:MAG: hypothetical protein JWM59_3446 [Verrucomicrobiales bacterium]|nr:hypothetical protein [Verrucomicrobiales bacterium]